MSAKNNTTAVEFIESYNTTNTSQVNWSGNPKPEVMYSQLKLPTSLNEPSLLPDFDDCTNLSDYEVVDFAFPKAVSSHKSDSSRINGVMVFYLDFGTLSPTKVEEYIQKKKKHLNENGFLDRLKAQGIESIFMPTRVQETKVEYIKL